MPSPAPNPLKKSVSDLRSSLLMKPALTSNYELYLSIPSYTDSSERGFREYLSANKMDDFSSIVQEGLQLSCSEATLPGSSLATLEINNDYTGVTERHAYRRIYDDRIDLTFYVDTNYTAIRFFETWIKYIVNESYSKTEVSGNTPGKEGLTSPNYFYTVRYPVEYQTNFSITKFERDYSRKLTYNFLQAYPVSISSMPISYDSSSLLKCTVSLSYVRYYIQELIDGMKEIPKPDVVGSTQNSDGSWTVELLDGNDIKTVNVSNEEYNSKYAPR